MSYARHETRTSDRSQRRPAFPIPIPPFRKRSTWAALRRVPRPELEARTFEIFSHLAEWLLYKTEVDLERTYNEIGVRRARQRVGLSDVVYAITATKEQLWFFLQDEGVVTKPVELFAEMELFRLLDQFFDKAIYYVTVGYEIVRVEQVTAAV